MIDMTRSLFHDNGTSVEINSAPIYKTFTIDGDVIMLMKINWMGHTFYIGNFIIIGDADNKPIFAKTITWFQKTELNKNGAIKRWRKLFSLHTQMYIRMKELKQVIRGQDLLNRRRNLVTRKEGKVFVCETTSVDEAYNLLQVKYLLKYYVIMAAMQSFTRI
ncbi:hypothetical protein Avbf_13959, partial [Armadillidium vulgare]